MPIFSKKLDKMSEKDLFTKGMFAYSNQDWKNACEYLGELIRRLPNNSEARMALAVSLFNLKKIDEALLQYDHLVSTNPENASFVAMRALCLNRNNQSDKAISELERSLEMKDDPKLRGLLLRLKGTEILDISGWGKKHSTHWGDAMVPGGGMVNLDFTGFMQEVAQACVSKGAVVTVASLHLEISINPDEYLKEELQSIEYKSGIKGFVALYPHGELLENDAPVVEFRKLHDGVVSYLFSARKLFADRAFEQAAEAARKVIYFGSEMTKFTRQLAEAWRIIGDVYLYQKAPDYKAAEEAYEKSESMAPGDSITLSRFIKLYRKMKKYDKARDFLRKLPEGIANSINVLYEKSLLLVEESEFDEAEEIARKLAEDASDRTYGWILLSHVLLKSERWQESIEASKKALELDEKEFSGWLNIGESYLGLKDFSEAEAAIERALQTKENYGNAWYLKSKILEATGRDAEAKAAMEKAELLGYEQ